MQSPKWPVQSAARLERFECFDAVEHVGHRWWGSADWWPAVELAQKRIALREQRSGECGAFGTTERLAFEQQPSQPRVNRHRGRFFAQLCKRPVPQQVKSFQQLE